jgi:hypothetical protein
VSQSQPGQVAAVDIGGNGAHRVVLIDEVLDARRQQHLLAWVECATLVAATAAHRLANRGCASTWVAKPEVHAEVRVTS